MRGIQKRNTIAKIQQTECSCCLLNSVARKKNGTTYEMYFIYIATTLLDLMLAESYIPRHRLQLFTCFAEHFIFMKQKKNCTDLFQSNYSFLHTKQWSTTLHHFLRVSAAMFCKHMKTPFDYCMHIVNYCNFDASEINSGKKHKRGKN